MRSPKTGSAPGSVLLVSRHDYRSRWRANFHPLADAFHSLGADVSFVSTGFSFLSKLANDRRNVLKSKPNTWEVVNGIKCFLWRTIFHPVKFGNNLIDNATGPIFRMWARSRCPDFDAAARNADLICVESDLSAVLIPRLRRVAPNALIVYIASDLLNTIGAAPQIQVSLERSSREIDHVVVVSRGMTAHLEHLQRPITYIPHGISPEDYLDSGSSPYAGKFNAVCVGSMLFDHNVVQLISRFYREVSFHLIGTPGGHTYPKNVVEHGIMPFRDTLPWLRFADVGIAPYRDSPASDYLADSSMKLRQYGFLGLPAVCPNFAVGSEALRFGYDPSDEASILAAFDAALNANSIGQFLSIPSWQDVALNISRLPKLR